MRLSIIDEAYAVDAAVPRHIYLVHVYKPTSHDYVSLEETYTLCP
jgi:hypothetical protein